MFAHISVHNKRIIIVCFKKISASHDVDPTGAAG